MPNLLSDWPKLDRDDINHIDWWLKNCPGTGFSKKSDAWHLAFTCKDSLKKAADFYLIGCTTGIGISITKPTYKKLWPK